MGSLRAHGTSLLGVLLLPLVGFRVSFLPENLQSLGLRCKNCYKAGHKDRTIWRYQTFGDRKKIPMVVAAAAGRNKEIDAGSTGRLQVEASLTARIV